MSNLLWTLSSAGLLNFHISSTIEQKKYNLTVTQNAAGPAVFFNASMQTTEFQFTFAGTDGSDTFSSNVVAHFGLASSIRPNGTAPNVTYDVFFALTKETRINSWDSGCTAACKAALNNINVALGPLINVINKVLGTHPLEIPDLGGRLTKLVREKKKGGGE